MSVFSKFLKEDNQKLIKNFKIRYDLYQQLVYLSEKIYPKASVNMLVIEALKDYLEKVQSDSSVLIIKPNKESRDYQSRTFYIESDLNTLLSNTSKLYGISMTKLINLAIVAALMDEAENLKEFDNQ